MEFDKDFNDKFIEIVKKVLGEIDHDSVIDSITFVELLVTLQTEFKLKFTTQEFINLRTLSLIKESLYKKILAANK